jgi:hypothetical protein
MSFNREPQLTTVPILNLRPTQITVGLREVALKRAAWKAHGHKPEFLGSHLIPVILGPKDRYYVIDHHHLSLALHQEGVSEIAVTVVANLSSLAPEAFWVFMDNRSWTHLYDQHGVRQDHKKLAKSVTGLIDDPFRSLAGALRRAGGYSKETTPFAEFLWADYMRRRLKTKLVENEFDAALAKALKLAKADAANFLPGWCGPIAD